MWEQNLIKSHVLVGSFQKPVLMSRPERGWTEGVVDRSFGGAEGIRAGARGAGRPWTGAASLPQSRPRPPRWSGWTHAAWTPTPPPAPCQGLSWAQRSQIPASRRMWGARQHGGSQRAGGVKCHQNPRGTLTGVLPAARLQPKTSLKIPKILSRNTRSDKTRFRCEG